MPQASAENGDRPGLSRRIQELEAALHVRAMRIAPAPVLPPDLTIRQLQVLAVVRAAPGTTAQQLAEQLGVSTATVSGVVDRMAGKGWLDRRPDPQDRRRLLLVVTGEAERLLGRLEQPAQAVRSRLLDGLTMAELQDLERLLARMHELAQEAADARS